MAYKSAKVLMIGETYKLCSGGPKMVIVATSKDNAARVCCGWFNEAGQYASEWFHIDTLEEA